MAEGARQGWAGKPNPGSDEALDMGCICAVMDNNHGKPRGRKKAA